MGLLFYSFEVGLSGSKDWSDFDILNLEKVDAKALKFLARGSIESSLNLKYFQRFIAGTLTT